MFGYLSNHLYNRGGKSFLHNVFFEVSDSDIKKAESILGFYIPEQLKLFYQEVGYGTLCASHDFDLDYDPINRNEILPPIAMANFSKGILAWENQTHWMGQDTHESLDLSPGDLPFFEISDGSQFMVMKALSDNPNAVWFMGMEKIEDSLESFIHNLYYDDPAYYVRRW